MSQGENELNSGAGDKSPVGAVAATPRAAQVTDPPTVVVSGDRQALAMAAAVFVVTMACWAGAQFACNKHPPQFKTPTALSSDQLAGTAKDAAIELQQRDLSGDVKSATEFAEGALLEELKAKQAQCQANGSCGAKATVLTRAEVLRNEGPVVVVRTVSLIGTQETRALMNMERRGSVWKATSRTAE